MGNNFCCGKSNSPLTNNFLFQINRFIPKSNSNSNSNLDSNNFSNNINLDNINDNNNNNNLKENLISEKGKYKFLFYDIKQNQKLIMEKKIEIIKTVEGLSELNLEQNLYLCGNNRLEDNEGSFLFEISPFTPKATILVNAIYEHYYPALIAFDNNFLLCIGGKNQIHCECYNIEEKYWTQIPDLPEERYRCTLCLDSKNDMIYLFGGINNKKQSFNNNEIYIENNNILRLKKEMYMSWEKIEIKNENEKNLLNRISASSLIFDDQEDNIYIFGGENQQNIFLQDIIKFDINTFSIIRTNQKLKFPTIFLNQFAKKCDKYTYVFLDTFNNVIKIDEHDYIQWSYHLLEI